MVTYTNVETDGDGAHWAGATDTPTFPPKVGDVVSFNKSFDFQFAVGVRIDQSMSAVIFLIFCSVSSAKEILFFTLFVYSFVSKVTQKNHSADFQKIRCKDGVWATEETLMVIRITLCWGKGYD